MSEPSTRSRLDKILPLLLDPKFRSNRGLSNEIGFHIFDYPPEEELIVRDHIDFLVKQIHNAGRGINLVVIDLFDLVLEILSQRKILSKIAEDEKNVGFDKVIHRLKPILKPENFTGLIKAKVDEATNMVFLTGVGKAYPLLRSHTVLNNLHHVFNQFPVIMFFPGVYDQRELMLFGKFKDNNYYRAFRLVES